MEQFLPYAPIILVVVCFAIQYKVFMTPADFEREKAKFLEYISEKYVSKELCGKENTHISEAFELIRKDIKSVEDKLDHTNELLQKRIEQHEG